MKMKMTKKKIKIRKRINKEELRQKTWKYFWQQKAKEVSITLGIILGLSILPYLLGIIGCSIYPNLDKFFVNKNSYACTLYPAWYKFYCLGLGVCFCLALLTFLIVILVYSIRNWINNNWEKAEERAKEELKK